MKATGIVRKLDQLRRIVLPSELCKTYGIEPETPIEIFTDDNGNIILRKYDPHIDHASDIEKLRREIRIDGSIDSAKKTDALVLLDKVKGLLG